MCTRYAKRVSTHLHLRKHLVTVLILFILTLVFSSSTMDFSCLSFPRPPILSERIVLNPLLCCVAVARKKRILMNQLGTEYAQSLHDLMCEAQKLCFLNQHSLECQRRQSKSQNNMNEQAGGRVEGQEMPVAQTSAKCCKNTQTNHITPSSYSSL